MHKNIKPPLLSIIIPNYNYGKFIARAIQSVCEQDYLHIELVVVDDGSSDNSVEVVEKALSGASIERTALLTSSGNAGKLAAINTALEEINGHYSIILDADDYLLPNYARHCIERLTEARRQDPKAAFVYTDCQLIDADGNRLDRGRSAAFDADMLEEFSYIPEPAVILTKALIEAAPYDETIRCGTKHHKWRRIVANGWRGVHLPEPLFCYRMHDNNLSGIGKRVTSEMDSGRKGERILSGYWPTAVS